jgi:hypothetical protein
MRSIDGAQIQTNLTESTQLEKEVLQDIEWNNKKQVLNLLCTRASTHLPGHTKKKKHSCINAYVSGLRLFVKASNLVHMNSQGDIAVQVLQRRHLLLLLLNFLETWYALHCTRANVHAHAHPLATPSFAITHSSTR